MRSVCKNLDQTNWRITHIAFKLYKLVKNIATLWKADMNGLLKLANQ